MQPFSVRDLIHLLGATALGFSIIVGTVYVKDPYGRSGIRPSLQVPNLGERELMVSRARDAAFDSAIVGNSTSIPLQPEILDKLADRRFVSLSISGSGAPVALTVALSTVAVAATTNELTRLAIPPEVRVGPTAYAVGPGR